MNDFDNLMNFDPVHAATSLTGQPILDPETFALSIRLAQASQQVKNFELFIRGDTYYGIEFDSAVNVFEGMGFETYHIEDIRNTDVWSLMWNPDGLLLDLESLTPENQNTALLNQARMFFNLRLAVSDSDRTLFESLMLGDTDVTPVIAGYADLHEGALHKMSKLRTAGRFSPVWLDLPWFIAPHSLSFEMGTEMSPGQMLRFDRQRLPFILQSFPAHVRDMIERLSDARIAAMDN